MRDSCRRSSICQRTCVAAGRTSACFRTCSSTSTRSGWISSRSGADCARAHADSCALVWFPGRPARDAGDALALRAPQFASAGGRRSAHALRAARARRSGAYTQGILSDKEVVLAGFQDWLRARLPVTQLVQAPRARRSRGAQSQPVDLTSADQIARRYHS